MSKIKVNEISKHDASEITVNDTVKVDTIAEKTSGAGVTVDGLTIKDTGFDEPVKMKSYTTSQINSLSGMGAGDTVYDSDLGTLKVYNGSSWNAMSGSTFSFTLNWLVIAGGASGAAQHGGGGGAGGYRSAYNSESSGGGGSAESDITVNAGTSYSVTVGAGGPAPAQEGSETRDGGTEGSNTIFGTITSIGGGAPGSWSGHAGETGGSGGGGSTGQAGGAGTSNQGYAGGSAAAQSGNDYTSGGGGGAGAVGSNGTTSSAGNGGNGVASTITGSSVTRAGGGGGGFYRGSGAADSYIGTGGTGGGGNGAVSNGQTLYNNAPQAGTANTGGGGGGRGEHGSNGSPVSGGNGGSGVVILRYPSGQSITIGAGLTGSTATDGDYKVTTLTAGIGNVSW